MAVSAPAAPGHGRPSRLSEFARWARGSDIGRAGPVAAVGVLVMLWVVFQILDPTFLTPRNLSSLSVDIVPLGLVATGVVFVLLVGDIDLSVASVSGLGAAVFAVLSVEYGVPEWLAVLTALLSGAAVGAFHGVVIGRLGVPGFVVTLAGLLGWSGLMMYLLATTGTVIIDSNGMVAALTSTYLPGAVGYVLAAVSVTAYVTAAWREARRRAAAGVPHRPGAEIAIRAALLAVPAFAAAAVLAAFEGLPLALLIFLVLIAGLDYILRRTAYGRKILSLGAGVEAARRAGIDVVAVRASAFMIASSLAALGGIFLASRITSVSQAAGSGDVLINIIAAAVIGGTSLFGGRGSAWSALIGATIIQSLSSGMAILGVQTPVQFMIIATVLLAAVVLDSLSRRTLRA